MYVTIAGTHDIRSVAIVEGHTVVTNYFEHSTASGALISLFLDSDGDRNNIPIVYLPLDKETSLNYMIPYDLGYERIEVFVYDIERDGTLPDGVGYPATTSHFNTSQATQSNFIHSHYTIISVIRHLCLYLHRKVMGD